MLGFIHKRILGQCHPGVVKLLPLDMRPSRWHGKQIVDPINQCMYHPSLYLRSLFGMVGVYNRLPPCLVEIESVTAFQKALTDIAKRRCDNDDPQWQLSFHSDTHLWRTRMALNL